VLRLAPNLEVARINAYVWAVTARGLPEVGNKLLVLPVTNGRELAATLRQSRLALPVIFITGFSRDTIVESQPSETDTYLLRKPFSFEQLADQLKAAATRIKT